MASESLKVPSSLSTSMPSLNSVLPEPTATMSVEPSDARIESSPQKNKSLTPPRIESDFPSLRSISSSLSPCPIHPANRKTSNALLLPDAFAPIRNVTRESGNAASLKLLKLDIRISLIILASQTSRSADNTHIPKREINYLPYGHKNLDCEFLDFTAHVQSLFCKVNSLPRKDKEIPSQ